MGHMTVVRDWNDGRITLTVSQSEGLAQLTLSPPCGKNGERVFTCPTETLLEALGITESVYRPELEQWCESCQIRHYPPMHTAVWQAKPWPCGNCGSRFATLDELVEHQESEAAEARRAR